MPLLLGPQSHKHVPIHSALGHDVVDKHMGGLGALPVQSADELVM